MDNRRPFDLADIERRLRDDRPVHVEIDPLTFGEKLVLWFRLNGETATFVFAMAAVALAVAVFVGAYVGRL